MSSNADKHGQSLDCRLRSKVLDGNMHVSLTPVLEEQVRLRVESGLYNNASEVIRESLRLLVERDVMRQRLQAELDVGMEQLERGELVTITSKEQFMALARQGR